MLESLFNKVAGLSQLNNTVANIADETVLSIVAQSWAWESQELDKNQVNFTDIRPIINICVFLVEFERV